MKLLLDTQLLIWASVRTEKLSRKARILLADEQHELHFSAASLWEIAIKNGLGRSDFDVDAGILRQGLLENGYVEIAIGGLHAVAVSNLPMLHRDPFDRMLLAQSAVEQIALVTADSTIGKYPGSVIRV